ncbi:MAG: flavin reductase family protein [Phycisphaerales bacterium]|nr:flavin reductase family protein [Phycisphaerales bacterium]
MDRVQRNLDVNAEDSHIDEAISHELPKGLFLMTAAEGEVRCGFITQWVQQCGHVPFQVSVAIPRGTAIEPVLRDSRSFALCALHPDDRVIQRRFKDAPDRQEDPYVGLQCFTDATGSPIVRRGRFYLDCELVGQLAMESDCRIYIGQVLAGRMLEPLESMNGSTVGRNGHLNGHSNGNGHLNAS